jgi:hypothetical protein
LRDSRSPLAASYTPVYVDGLLLTTVIKHETKWDGKVVTEKTMKMRFARHEGHKTERAKANTGLFKNISQRN